MGGRLLARVDGPEQGSCRDRAELFVQLVAELVLAFEDDTGIAIEGSEVERAIRLRRL